jgi:thiamine-phosphate pyrophosphorylase
MGLKHQAVVARKWRTAVRRIESHFPVALPPILFLTDPDRVADPTAIVPRLPAGSGLVYRHFGSDDRVIIARALSRACAEHEIAFLISADPGLARATKATGVHWPERKLPETRRWRGQFALQTASAHSPDAIRRANRAGMNAVLVSTVFPSASPSAGHPMGPIRLRNLERRARVPIYALGGLTSANAGQIAGFAGIASVSGFAAL